MIQIIVKFFSLVIFSAIFFDDKGAISSELLGYKEGYVRNESFIYYYIYYSGNIVLSLTSSQGDADMYISESKKFPTFYPETYDLHSATCGIEILEIPVKWVLGIKLNTFKSPIAVGVYGHSAFELSSFVLEVYKNSVSNKAFALIEDELLEGTKDSSMPNQEPKSKLTKSRIKKRVEEIEANPRDIFSLFEILKLLFL